MCNGSNEVWIFECSFLVYIFAIINLTISKNKNLNHSLTNFVNSRTSSNWSSKLKKSEQVCKEGEPDPAPSPEITEQTYNGRSVWIDTWLSPIKCFLLHVYAEGTTCISYPGSIKGSTGIYSELYSIHPEAKGCMVTKDCKSKSPYTIDWTWIS